MSIIFLFSMTLFVCIHFFSLKLYDMRRAEFATTTIDPILWTIAPPIGPRSPEEAK